MKKVPAIFLGLSFVLAGCTATTSFESVQSEVSLKVNEKPTLSMVNAANQTYPTTSFGQYKFKAEKEGIEPMYGLIPLKFNGGYLAADILFFAPAMFFNLREVFPFYQFDLEKNEVRYKKKASDDWIVYSPTTEEIEHAKMFFNE